MSVRDGDLPSDEEIAARARAGRAGRARMVVGAAGLALLVSGGYLVSAQLTERNAPTVNRAPGALAPMVPVTQSAPGTAPTIPVTRSAPTTATERDGIGPAPSAVAGEDTRRSLTAAGGRGRGAAGGQVQGGAGGQVRGGAGGQVRAGAGGQGRAAAVSTSVRSTAEGSIRVTTAKSDLTDLLPAADGGSPAGHSRCSRNLLGGPPAPARLLCWRTSADRSVITLATATTGRPSTAVSLTVLDREWARLG